MRKNYFTILILLVLPNLLIAQYIGVFAKNEGKLCFEKTIYTEEDASLSYRLLNAKAYSIEIIERFEIDDRQAKRLTFTDNELKALKGNFMGYEVDDYIERVGDNIPDDYYAVGISCRDDDCQFYDPKYKQYENWARYRTLESALIKMMEILQMDISKSERDNKYQSLVYDYRSLSVLYGIVQSLKATCDADEFAIVMTSY